MAEPSQRSLPSPIFVPALLWIAGIIFACLIPLSLSWLLSISVLAIALGFILRFRLPVVLVLVMLAGMLRMTIVPETHVSPLLKYAQDHESITQKMQGRVIKPLGSNRDAYLVRLTSIRNIRVEQRALLYTEHRLLPGDNFHTTAKLEYVQSDAVLSSANNRLYRNRYQTPLQIHTVYQIDSHPSGSWVDVELWRYLLLQKMDKKLGNAAGFAKALLFNDRTTDRQWVEQLIKGGLLHLIAISGMHVILLYFIFVTLFQMVLSRRYSELLFILLMLIYAALCQWSAPVMRAIIMILLYVLAKWLQRPVSALQILSLSLIVITLFDPLQLFSIGLQLSYACILVLMYAVPKRGSRPRIRHKFKALMAQVFYYFYETVLISVLLGILLLPLMMFHFQRGSLNGVIGNLIGIPLIAALLPLTILLLILPGNWMVFHWFKASFDFLHRLFEMCVNWTAGLPFYLDATGISLSGLAGCYLSVMAVLLYIRKTPINRFFAYSCACVGLVVWGFSLFHAQQRFRLICFNAGMGDCSVAVFPDGQVLLVDTGPQSFQKQPGNYAGWFGNKAQNWFKNNKITTIDILVLSHLHNDHSGGLSDVLANLKVRNIIINRLTASTPEWKALVAGGTLREARISVLADTLTIPFAGSILTFLHPGKDYVSPDANEDSSVMRLDYHGFSALFAGDITAGVEAKLAEEMPEKLDCDWLKAPHHGSRYSNSSGFIRSVSPQRVIITASRHNRFRFPHRDTMQRYRSYGVEPDITGNGSVQISLP